MTNSNLNKMVSAALEKDAIGFKDAFDAATIEKISTAIDNKTNNISKDIVTSAESPKEDA
tara:strand:+ start:49 stop:228 length:180 start_codon:yes stop_codon:yes gene_type:complete